MNRIAIDIEEFFSTEPRVVVAGYTGADQAKVREHIDELAAIGVAPPPQIPEFYLMPSGALTQSATISANRRSSGEAEPVLLRRNGKLYVTLGSDHTDRELEVESILASKSACPKPIATEAFEYGPEIENRVGDTLGLACSVDGAPYQDDRAALLPLLTTLSIYQERFEDDGGDLVLFGGTVPLIGGEFRYGSEWRLVLDLDGDRITHTYHQTDDDSDEEQTHAEA